MKRSIRRQLAGTVVLILLVSTVGFVFGQQRSRVRKSLTQDGIFEAVSSYPPLKAEPVEPVIVKRRDHVVYAIVFNDADTYRVKNGKIVTFPMRSNTDLAQGEQNKDGKTVIFQDQNCILKPLKIRSMKTFHLSYRGCTPTTQNWDIVGDLPNKPGTYIDEWEASNSPQKEKILRDKPVTIKVEVRIQ